MDKEKKKKERENRYSLLNVFCFQNFFMPETNFFIKKIMSSIYNRVVSQILLIDSCTNFIF